LPNPDSTNQYTTINGAAALGHDCQGNAQQYSYDCNGNLTGDGTWSYAYDPENRLITANKTSGGTVAATYAYDPLGRRTHKSGTGVTETYFLSDGSDEIAEYSSSGTGTWRYIPGPAINEPITTINASTGARKYFQTDHHGSVIAIVSNGGNELEGPYTYDSYGNCFTTGAACSTSGTPYRFTGMRLDPETGLYYDRARYYSSALGRFMQTDPVGYDADLDLYTYGNNDPLDRADPSGACDDDGERHWGWCLWHRLGLYDTRRDKIKRARQFFKNNSVSIEGEKVDESQLSDDEVLETFNEVAAEWKNIAKANPGIDPSALAAAGSPALRDSPYHPDAVAKRIKPPYRANPAHDPSSPRFNPGKSPEPADAADVYNKGGVRGDMHTWYGKGQDGYYQYYDDNAGGVHFAGVVPASKVPNAVMKLLH